jgi:hypothetical protein
MTMNNNQGEQERKYKAVNQKGTVDQKHKSTSDQKHNITHQSQAGHLIDGGESNTPALFGAG